MLKSPIPLHSSGLLFGCHGRQVVGLCTRWCSQSWVMAINPLIRIHIYIYTYIYIYYIYIYHVCIPIVGWMTRNHVLWHIYMSQMLHGAGIFTYIYPKNGPNVGKYSIHGASGYDIPWVVRFLCSCRLLQTPIYGEWPSLFAGSSKKNALSLGLWAPCQICEFL